MQEVSNRARSSSPSNATPKNGKTDAYALTYIKTKIKFTNKMSLTISGKDTREITGVLEKKSYNQENLFIRLSLSSSIYCYLSIYL